MSIAHVSELRKKGLLEDAYREAVSDLVANPNVAATRISIAGVLSDLLVIRSSEGNNVAFCKGLRCFYKLKIPASEIVFWEKLSWIVALHVNKIAANDVGALNDLFAAVSLFRFPPSKGYSVLFMAFHKHREQWPQYIDFCDWWNFDSFREDDFAPFVMDNGRSVMALAEQAMLGYTKSLEKSFDKEKVQTFLDKIENERWHRFKYFALCKASLLFLLGNKNAAISACVPFLKKNSSLFWVWERFAGFIDDVDLRFSCLSKALLCKTPDEYLVSLRISYAKELVARKLYNEAKFEVERTLRVRKSKGWSIPADVTQMASESWFVEAISTDSNECLYQKYALEIEEKIFGKKNQDKSVKSRETKEFIGVLHIDAGRNFGLVVINNKERVFVSSKHLGSLSDNDKVCTVAVKSFDKKKNRDGWRAISIKKV